MTHHLPAPVDSSTPEPVAVAAAVQAVLVAAAALGWTYLDDARIAAVVSAVATVGTVAAVLVARGRVRAIRPTDPTPPAATADPAELAAVRDDLDALMRSLGYTSDRFATGPAGPALLIARQRCAHALPREGPHYQGRICVCPQ